MPNGAGQVQGPAATRILVLKTSTGTNGADVLGKSVKGAISCKMDGFHSTNTPT